MFDQVFERQQPSALNPVLRLDHAVEKLEPETLGADLLTLACTAVSLTELDQQDDFGVDPAPHQLLVCHAAAAVAVCTVVI